MFLKKTGKSPKLVGNNTSMSISFVFLTRMLVGAKFLPGRRAVRCLATIVLGRRSLLASGMKISSWKVVLILHVMYN